MNIISGKTSTVVSSRDGRHRHPKNGFHISGRNKGIREIDLDLVFWSSTQGFRDSHEYSPTKDQEDEEVRTMLGLITSLDLSRNEIENLSNLCSLQSLRVLDVRYNHITQISGLPRALTRLNLSHNKLRDVRGLASLPHLRELDISFNRLANFEGLNPRLPLQVLKADDNRIVSTLGLEEALQLRFLSLANNFIENVNELAFLYRTTSLRSLNLKDNPITHLSEYRQMVARRQKALVTLDGEPLLHYSLGLELPRKGKVGGAAMPSSLHNPEGQNEGGHDDAAAAAAPHAPDCSFGTADRIIHTPKRKRLHGTPEDQRSSAGLAESPPPRASACAPAPTPFDFSDVAVVDLGIPSKAESEMVTAGPLLHSRSFRIHSSGSGGSYAKQFGAQKTVLKNLGRGRLSGMELRRSSPSPIRGTHVAGNSPKPPLLLPFHRPKLHNTCADVPPPNCAKAIQTSPPSSPVSLSMHLGDAAQDHRATQALLHDCLVSKEQLQKENQNFRAQLKKKEAQLSEARRVISEQLGKLSSTRIELDALRQAESELREQLDRSRRHAKAVEGSRKTEVKTLQEQGERMKAFYEAQIADLRRQLAAAMSRPEHRAATKCTSGSKQRVFSTHISQSEPVLESSAVEGVVEALNGGKSIDSDDDARLKLPTRADAALRSTAQAATSILESSPLASALSSSAATEQQTIRLRPEMPEDAPKTEMAASCQELRSSMQAVDIECSDLQAKNENSTQELSDACAVLEAMILRRQETVAMRSQAQEDLQPFSMASALSLSGG